MVAAGVASMAFVVAIASSVGHRHPVLVAAAGRRHRRRQLDALFLIYLSPLSIVPLVADIVVLWGVFVADWTPQTPVGHDSQRKDHAMKVLVTAASRHGSTAEIATIIAGILQASDIDAEVLPPEAVASVVDYDAVILGSAVYAGQWLEPAEPSSPAMPTISRHDRSSCSRAARWAIHRVGRWSRPTPSPSRPRLAPWTCGSSGSVDRAGSEPAGAAHRREDARAIRGLPPLGRHPRLDARDRPLIARGVGRGGRRASGRWRRVTRPPDRRSG